MGDRKGVEFSSTLLRVMSFLRKEGLEQATGELLAEVKNNYPEIEIQAQNSTAPNTQKQDASNVSNIQRQQFGSSEVPEGYQEAEELRSLMQTPPATHPEDFYKNKKQTSSTTGMSEEYQQASEEVDFEELQSVALGSASLIQSQDFTHQNQRSGREEQQQSEQMQQQKITAVQFQQLPSTNNQQHHFFQSQHVQTKPQNTPVQPDIFKTSWPDYHSRQQSIERMDSTSSPATPSSCMTSPASQDPATQYWVGTGGYLTAEQQQPPTKMNRVNSLTELSEGQYNSSNLITLDTFRSANEDDSVSDQQDQLPTPGRSVGFGGKGGALGGFGFSFPVSPVEEQQTEVAKRTFSSWNSMKSALSETPSEEAENSDNGEVSAEGGVEFEFSSPDVSPTLTPQKQPPQTAWSKLQISSRMKSEPVISTFSMFNNYSPNSDNSIPPLKLCEPVSQVAIPSYYQSNEQIENSCHENSLAEHMESIESTSRTSSDAHLEYDPHFIEQQYEVFNLRIVHPKRRTGFEEPKELQFRKGDLIAGQYEVRDFVGAAAFSNAIYAYDIKEKRDVCLKIIKNKKDYFDQSLDEIKLLRYINQADPHDTMNVLRLHDYFYYREHLILVCELLHQNLYEWQKYTKEHKLPPYFTLSRVQSIAKQVLTALKFLHSLDLIHADLKPENILIKNYEKCEVKVIDLGSSCFKTDMPSSYIQSRSYRSPEVILGAPYDTRIDIWSLGCILAELLTGGILFENSTVPTLLSRVTAVFGPFSDNLLQKSKNRNRFVTDSGLIFERTPTGHFSTPKLKRTSLRAKVPQADEDCLKFLAYLLTVDPEQRPTAEQALEHPWLKKSYMRKTYDMDEGKQYMFNIDRDSPGFEFAQSNALNVSMMEESTSSQFQLQPSTSKKFQQPSQSLLQPLQQQQLEYSSQLQLQPQQQLQYPSQLQLQPQQQLQSEYPSQLQLQPQQQLQQQSANFQLQEEPQEQQLQQQQQQEQQQEEGVDKSVIPMD